MKRTEQTLNDMYDPVFCAQNLPASSAASFIREKLRSVGYVIPENALNDLIQVLRHNLPWLIEGPRGGGKTALAEALAEAFRLEICYLQCMSETGREELLYSWDEGAQKIYAQLLIEQGVEIRQAIARTFSRDFLVLGEAARAYALAAERLENPAKPRPILILDEVDKLDERAEDMLLQLLGRGVCHVPRLGEIGTREQSLWPIVVLLSNDLRHDLSPPLRSRCFYTYLPAPTISEQREILRARCPEATPEQREAVLRVIAAINHIPGITDRPGLREAVQLVRALAEDEVCSFDRSVWLNYLGFLTKRQQDRFYLEKSIDRLAAATQDLSDPTTLDLLGPLIGSTENHKKSSLAENAHTCEILKPFPTG